MTSDFIAEDDLNTFDEYLRLQGVDPSTAGPAVHALEYSGDHRAYHISLRESVGCARPASVSRNLAISPELAELPSVILSLHRRR